MRRSLAVVGAPSSAGAYAPGQERAPAALREAGLVPKLRQRGLAVADHGDLPVIRWAPDAMSPRAQNIDAVLKVVRGVTARVDAALDAGLWPLVLGGDCTVGIGTVAALAARAERVGLVYLDLHADMNTPVSVRDGALDWMGLGHMLALPDTVGELTRVGGRVPLLPADHVALIGFDADCATPWEREMIGRTSVAVTSVEAVRLDPARAARNALEALAEQCDVVALHFDVDLVDFTDAPLSQNTGRNVGVTLATALRAVEELMHSARLAALTLTELNPLQGDPGGATLRRFVDGFVNALEHNGEERAQPA